MNEWIPVVLIAFVLDIMIGDPQNPLHPVRVVGKGISLGLRFYHKVTIHNKIFSFLYGMMLSLIIIAASYFVTKIIIDICAGIHVWLGLAVQIILCYFLIAARALKEESMKVYRSVCVGDLQGARKNLSYIVGRDTAHLSFAQIITASVETVAENFSDGVVAPLFFVCIGGLPLGMAYKAVNTLDSMLGYRDETYEYLGKFPARLDDVANFIPARVAAILMIVSAALTKGDVRQAIRIFRRDRYHHKSPNSAQTEAVCAGALGLLLGGDHYYHGELVPKPTIGDAVSEPEASHIVAANRMMYVASVLTVLAVTSVAFMRSYWIYV